MAAIVAAVIGVAGSMMASDNQPGGSSGSAQQAADPYGPYRGGAAQQLNSLMKDPSSITKTPGYQFGLDQGTNAIQTSNAASGKALGGGEQQQLMKFGQDYAQTNFSNYANILAQLSGASWQAGGNAANAQLGQQAINSQNAGVIGQAVGSGIKSIYNNYSSGSGTTTSNDYSNVDWNSQAVQQNYQGDLTG